MRSLAAVLLAAVQAGAVSDPDTWPGWRGDGSGISGEKNPPIHWRADAGVAWRTELPGAGNSSPVVWGDRVFLTAFTDGGTNRLVLCIDRNDGNILWRSELPAARVPKTHVKNGYASATAATDGERVYAFFDSPGLAALDMDGKVLWTRDLGPFKNSYNMAGSPVLHGDLVIACCDQEEGSFIVALDKRTGEERWRTPRPGMSMQFATPLVIAVDGKSQVVVNGQTVVAYDPDSGRELWSCRGMRPNVTPSAVACGELVYAVSGRNGPALAICPTGSGDVTETHVRMQIPSGGPYIPSPLAFPEGLLLPGDDGRLRLIGKEGQVLCERRVSGHFTASPVAAGNLIYWPNEKGDVAVVRLADDAEAPRLELVAVNEAGGGCMASVAIAGGKLFLRTDKTLVCVGGTSEPGGAALAAELPGSFTELKRLYDEHPATDGPDAALRIAIVEKLAAMDDGESITLLQTAALKDPQWDVGEAAAKSLATIGRPAIPALIALMGAVDWQPYLKTIAAEALGQLGAVEAIPALLKGAADRNPLVRLPSLQALGRIAASHDAERPKIAPALIGAMGDREGIVRRTAIEALAANAGALAQGSEWDAVVERWRSAAGDANPLVAEAALAALKVVPSAGQPVAPSAAVEMLRAGPVDMKFQDGELRYLRVGGKEIVRRIYFAVRDRGYDTVMPVFRSVSADVTNDAFTIRLAAVCSNDTAGFSWTGTITGSAEGRIVFHVDGVVDRDFQSPRVGLNVLFGTESLAGQDYELVAEDGKVSKGAFPVPVATELLSDGFRTLRYRTSEGLQVNVGLADGRFGMEDQRKFCDSSYKAFGSMAFKYMGLKKGQQAAQTITVDVDGAKAGGGGDSAALSPLRIAVGAPVPGAVVPKLTVAEAPGGEKAFYEIIGTPGHQAAEELTWRFNVAAHLPDNDTFLENIPAIVDQAKAVRLLAPEARIRIDPATFLSPYPRPAPDARLNGPFGAAWAVRMVKYLALAGVDEAVLGAGGAAAPELARLAGSRLLATTVEGGRYPAVADALAVETDGERQVWVVNVTATPVSLTVTGFDAGNGVVIKNGWTRHGEARKPERGAGGDVRLELGPFEICRLTAGARHDP